MKMKYEWDQDSTTVQVSFTICDNSRNVSCKIINRHLVIRVDNETVIEGELFDWTKAESAFWTVSDGRVEFCVDKLYNAWWDYLVEGSEIIERSRGYLDKEKKGLVERMIVEQPETKLEDE